MQEGAIFLFSLGFFFFFVFFFRKRIIQSTSYAKEKEFKNELVKDLTKQAVKAVKILKSGGGGGGGGGEGDSKI